MPLNARQERFVAEYLVDLNATQAAIRAGYSPRSAYSQAGDLLKKPEIAAAVAAGNVATLEKAAGSAEWVVEKAVEVVNRALDAVPVTRMERGRLVTVEGEWTCNLGAAVPALALLARRHPEFSEKHEVEAKVGVMLVRQTRGLRG